MTALREKYHVPHGAEIHLMLKQELTEPQDVWEKAYLPYDAEPLRLSADSSTATRNIGLGERTLLHQAAKGKTA